MPVYTCVLTGKGHGAIGSVLLYGQGAQSILAGSFTPAASFKTGRIVHGQIVEGNCIYDDVVVGCEGENQFAVHCHGNPVLVQKIAGLFVRRGAQFADAENILFPGAGTSLEKEAAIEQLKAVTVQGVQIIQSQISGGLSAAVRGWRENSVTMEEVQRQCKEILARSQIARQMISGVKIVLAGPANSGKSTLLNALAGGTKAIVSDIPGTTRDWVSVVVHIGPLRAEIIDTAGLGENAVRDNVDTAAQHRTIDLIRQCDCVLWIEDGTNPSKTRYVFPPGIPVIEVSNKSDLPGDSLLQTHPDRIPISAKTGDGIDVVLSEIQKWLGVCEFDCSLPAVFTGRQEKLLEAIIAVRQPEEIYEYLVKLAG